MIHYLPQREQSRVLPFEREEEKVQRSGTYLEKTQGGLTYMDLTPERGCPRLPNNWASLYPYSLPPPPTPTVGDKGKKIIFELILVEEAPEEAVQEK
jgi:hypothetical protein